MTIKDRVLASLKTSYSKYGFKKDELSSLTDLIAANLTDESTDEQITAAVTAAEGYARMMQTVYNRGISETNKKFEGYVKPEPQPQDPPADPPKGLTAEEIQKLIADGIAAGLKPFQEREERARLQTMLQGHEKLKDVPAVFRERYSLDKEENLESVVSKIEADYTALKQSLVASGQYVPAPATGDTQSETDDFVKEMEGFAQRHAPEPSAK